MARRVGTEDTSSILIRKIKTRLWDRVRVTAAIATIPGHRVTMEDIFNRALAAGLPEVEKQVREDAKKVGA